MRHGTALISGAGIAGPALAYWLRQHGFTPTIVERAPAPRCGGQAIDLRGAAREVVERMGIMATVRAHHTGTHGIAFVDARGRRRASMGGDSFGDSGGIIADLEILRGDLGRILREAAGPEIEYRYDDVITDLAQGEDGVKVTFGAAPTRSFDLVVGADGLRSGVRSLAFGPDAGFVRDLGLYTAYFTGRTGRDLAGWEEVLNLPAGNGVGGRVAMLYPLRDTDEVRVLLSFVAPDLAVDRRDVAAQKRLLHKVFAGSGWELPGLLDQLDDAEDLYFDRSGEVRIDRWSAERVVLLGDAAFGGSLGMGTSMALVGAYVLAGELAAADGDHRVAFAEYERLMRPYVTASQKRPPGGNSGFAPRTNRGIWLRNQVMRAMAHLPGKDVLMGGIEKSANAIDLKDYGR